MKRQFPWPTRTWNKQEIMNLLYMFCPQSEKYQEYMETIQILHKNNLIQNSLYEMINTMNALNNGSEYQTIDYKILRGSFQQRVTAPCSGFGQLLIQGRARIQYVDLNEEKVIRVRPYGDARVVDEILLLAIHLCLVIYDTTNDTIQLTELGKNVIDVEKENKEKHRDFNWWQSVMLHNPLVFRILDFVRKGSETNDSNDISLIEIGENIGFYDGIYYNPVSYIGYMYTLDAQNEAVNLNAYIMTVLNALENENLVASKKIFKNKYSENGCSSSHFLTCYTITVDGFRELKKDRNKIMSLLLLQNGESYEGDEERRSMIMTLLAFPEILELGGLTIPNICDFFKKHKRILPETVMLDIFGFLRLGIPILYRMNENDMWKTMTIDDIPKIKETEISLLKFHSPIKLVGDDKNYPNMSSIVNISKMKYDFIPHVHRKYQYLPLVDYLDSVIDENGGSSLETLKTFNQLLADMLYYNMNYSPYIFYNDRIITKNIIPMLFCYKDGKKYPVIVDTSGLFMNNHKTEVNQKPSLLIDEPECTIQDKVKSFFLDIQREQVLSEFNMKNPIDESEYYVEYSYLEDIIIQAILLINDGWNMDEIEEHAAEVDELYDSLQNKGFQYIVLYNGDLEEAQNIYRNVFSNIPLFRKADVEYRDWFQFVDKCIEN